MPHIITQTPEVMIRRGMSNSPNSISSLFTIGSTTARCMQANNMGIRNTVTGIITVPHEFGPVQLKNTSAFVLHDNALLPQALLPCYTLYSIPLTFHYCRHSICYTTYSKSLILAEGEGGACYTHSCGIARFV